MASSAWSVLVGVEFDTKTLQRKLDQQNLKLKADVSGSDKLENLADRADAVGLSFQAANAILRQTIDIVTAMVDQVYALDSALTEFKKVSDLSGSSLDAYVDKLAGLGTTVARTGQPCV